jgi:gamma-glutamylcyclotransferase (GGCT)/AIG2-like uncharacterized protein YtfP
MSSALTPLFVYGTLRPGHAPAELAHFVAALNPIGKGSVRGHLLDLGDYPGAILEQNGASIPGTVFEIPSGTTLLSRLDAYEEFYPSNPEKSLFLRERTNVKMEDGSTRECWIYTYNRKVNQLGPASAR